MAKIENQKLLNDALDVVATGATYRCRRTGREIVGLPMSTVIERLLEKGWRNISGGWGIQHDLDDSGFTYAVADKNLNAGSRYLTGDWVQVYSDGSLGRPVAKATFIVTVE